MALGLLSRRESRKDLWPRLIILMVAWLPLSPLSSSFRLMQPDVGAQEPDATADAYYYVETAGDQE